MCCEGAAVGLSHPSDGVNKHWNAKEQELKCEPQKITYFSARQLVNRRLIQNMVRATYDIKKLDVFPSIWVHIYLQQNGLQHMYGLLSTFVISMLFNPLHINCVNGCLFV